MLRTIALLWFPLLSIAADRQTVWSGVFTRAQASAGASVFAASCSRCHRDRLQGPTFIEHWNEDYLSSLYNLISKTMPPGAAGSLKESEYADVVAFLLQSNGYPEGTARLTASQMGSIRMEGKNGPEPVPEFSLVQTTGCLTKGSDGNWRLRNAIEPVRTRVPKASTAKELADAASLASGQLTFRLLDDSGLKPDANNRRAKVKGLLIRKSGDDRLNPTMVELLEGVCEAAH